MRTLSGTPDMTWLTGPHDLHPFGSSVALLAAGYAWDAVRTSEELGLATAGRLLGNAHDRDLLGPVLYSRRSHHVHWLIRSGSTADYPDGCKHLGRSYWLVAPGDHALHPEAVRWLHLPEAGILTSAAWLAAALHGTRPTGGTR